MNKRLLAQIGNPYNLDNFRAKDSLKGTRKLGKLSPEGSLKFNHELRDLRIKTRKTPKNNEADERNDSSRTTSTSGTGLINRKIREL